MLIDAGVLIAVDRGDREAGELVAASTSRATVLRTTHPVVAQVWRDGTRQAVLSRLLRRIEIHSLDHGFDVGVLLAAAGTRDVVDAHLVVLAARFREPVLTGDPGDLEQLAACLPHPVPRILHWT